MGASSLRFGNSYPHAITGWGSIFCFIWQRCTSRFLSERDTLQIHLATLHSPNRVPVYDKIQYLRMLSEAFLETDTKIASMLIREEADILGRVTFGRDWGNSWPQRLIQLLRPVMNPLAPSTNHKINMSLLIPPPLFPPPLRPSRPSSLQPQEPLDQSAIRCGRRAIRTPARGKGAAEMDLSIPTLVTLHVSWPSADGTRASYRMFEEEQHLILWSCWVTPFVFLFVLFFFEKGISSTCSLE